MREVVSPMPNGDPGGKTVRNDENSAGGAGRDGSTPDGSPRRYTLLASLPAGGADGMVTFADLRSTLKKKGEAARAIPVDFAKSDRNELLDVYKSRF
jgi:hypothetical protein